MRFIQDTDIAVMNKCLAKKNKFATFNQISQLAERLTGFFYGQWWYLPLLRHFKARKGFFKDLEN